MQTIAGEGGYDPSRTYLPKSFLGSKRYRRSMIADALAVVRRFGNPTFFITMTTNHQWTKTLSQLLPDQNASNRPDVVLGVHHAKQRQLTTSVRDILSGHCKVYSIPITEFQKRGLPHLHLAIKVGGEPTTPGNMDEVISAKSPQDDEELFQLVNNFMIRQHCVGRCYQTEARKKFQICHYGYPKPLVSGTYHDESGYPHYRRRSEQDRYVVPYNTELLRIFKCHFIVELSQNVKLIMYLYKYLYKGADYTKGKIQKNEIQEYLDGRYLSALEAMYRLFQFDITRRHPTVKCCGLHQENKNWIVFKNGTLDSTVPTISTFERYFLRPSDRNFDQFTYLEYFEQYMDTTNRPKKAPID